MELFAVAFDRSRLGLLVALAALTLSAAPASAEGLFDFFHNGGQQRGGWGGWFGSRPRQYVPQQASPYADPSQSERYSGQHGPASAPSSGSGGGRASYCVRLCDGRYFPLPRSAGASPAQLCGAFCPAAKTAVFNGSQIDHAYASSGQRYADLENAFVYRQKVVAGCTCNGKDSFGLARIDVAADPTLRPGDIVASGDNVKAALIAMQAARERGQAAAERGQAAAERPALRGSRTATAAPPPATKTDAAPVPSVATDDIPED